MGDCMINKYRILDLNFIWHYVCVMCMKYYNCYSALLHTLVNIAQLGFSKWRKVHHKRSNLGMSIEKHETMKIISTRRY